MSTVILLYRLPDQRISGMLELLASQRDFLATTQEVRADCVIFYGSADYASREEIESIRRLVKPGGKMVALMGSTSPTAGTFTALGVEGEFDIRGPLGAENAFKRLFPR